jgi:hypothetical protein
VTPDPELDEDFEQEEIDWGDQSDEPIACGVENPDICESCT